MITYTITHEAVFGMPERISINVLAKDDNIDVKCSQVVFKSTIASELYFKICGELMQACTIEIKRQIIRRRSSEINLL